MLVGRSVAYIKRRRVLTGTWIYWTHILQFLITVHIPVPFLTLQVTIHAHGLPGLHFLHQSHGTGFQQTDGQSTSSSWYLIHPWGRRSDFLIPFLFQATASSYVERPH
jgi:hypothetical protein